MGCCATMRYCSIKPEWEEAAREYIPAYIFYRNCRDGYGQPAREAFCTHCGEIWEVGKGENENGYLARTTWGLKHNQVDTCPQCGCEAMAKCDGRIRYFANLNGHFRMVFGEKIARDHVKLKAYYIEYYFENFQWTRPEMGFSLDMEYDLRPGEVSVKKWNQWNGAWKDVGIQEPWPIVDGLNGVLKTYRASLSGLADTFLGYLPFEQISDWFWPRAQDHTIDATPWCKLLCYAALYPQVEFVCKGGGTDLVQDLVYTGKKNASVVNWRGKNLAEFLRMPKADAKLIAQAGFDLDALRMRKKYGISTAKAVQWSTRMFTAHDLEEGAGQLDCDPVRLAEYLIRQGQGSHGIHVLRDYRDAARKLGRDMSVELILWPKNLTQAHDDAIDAARAIEKEEERQAYGERYRELVRRFEFETDDYTVIVPERLEDIKREGADQHHCVGGYAGRHAKGTTAIVFIRRTMLRAVPLYTVEIDPKDGRIRQIQGYHNEFANKPTADAQAFVDLWQREIARRLRKEKRQAEKNARAEAGMEVAAT